jgi:glutamate-1-semialdehyde aminotransferase
MPFLRLADEENPLTSVGPSALHTGLHAAWIRGLVQRGAFLSDYHNIFVSAVHDDADLSRTWELADQSFADLKRSR